VRELKSLKRDFPPAEIDARPLADTTPGSTLLEETAETFTTIHEPDFFPQPLAKPTTSRPRNIFETNPFEPYTPPAYHGPDPRDTPSSPPNPLPKAA